MRIQRLNTLGLVGAALAVWTAVYAVGALDLYLVLRRFAVVSYAQLFTNYFPWAVVWALLTPVVLSFRQRRPLRVGRFARAFSWHLAMSLAFTSVFFALETVRVWRELALPWRYLGDVAAGSFNLRVLLNVVNYWLILFAGYSYDFYRSTKSGERLTRELQDRLSRAQLASLRAQLHPHFLFNSFNAIASLVRQGRTEESVEMISDVSRLLRHTLEHRDDLEIVLAQEVDFALRYLQVEQYRFADKLVLETDLQPRALEGMVPNLLLQPLVENAVKHGISKLTTPGRVRLACAVRDGRLHISVGNSTPPAAEGPANASFGIGLSNSRERLAMHYGDAAALLIDVSEPGWYRAEVYLPFRAARTN